MHCKPTILLTVSFLLFAASLSGAEAVGWRGDGSGSYPNARPPRSWSKDSGVVWKAELPGRGYGSPVILGKRLFVMAEPAHVICLNADDGEVAWQGTVDYAAALGEKRAAEIEQAYKTLDEQRRKLKKPYDELRKADPESKKLDAMRERLKEVENRKREYSKKFPQERRGGAGNVAATPLCNGKQIFAAFGTGIVAAFDLEGKRLWAVHIEGPVQGFGHAASPVLAGGKLIVHYQDLVALDPASGKQLWRTKLPAKFGTSVVATIAGQDVLVSPAGALVRASDGHILAEKLFKLSNNSPLVHNGVIYAHESGKTRALRLPSSLDEPVELETLWEETSTRDQRMASAAYHNGLLYAGGRRGIIEVTDAKTGEVLYQERMELGDLFPSVAVAGDLVFISGRDGKTAVLKSGRDYNEISTNQLDRFGSTPIFAGRKMYVRCEKFLYCIGE
jgi:outer membrane protein assembly factor BamB